MRHRGAADRQADADRLQRRRHRRGARGAQRRSAPTRQTDGRGDHRAASAAAGRAGRRRRSLCRARADGAALPAHPHRPRLRRRHGKPLLLVGRRRRMGRAVVLGERIAVRPQEPAAVSAACSPRRSCRCRSSSASATIIATGWPAPRRSTVSTATSSSSTRSTGGDRSIAGTVWIDRRSFARVRVCRPCRRTCRRPCLESGNPALHARRHRSTGVRCSCCRRSIGQQIVMIAGRNLLVERSVVFRDFTVNGAGFAEARARRPEGRQHHVPRHRRGPALLREARRDARRQRSADDKGEGGGDGRHDRSVVRVSAADLRHQLPRTSRFAAPRHAVRDAVRRRAGGHQHPAAEAAAHAVRRERSISSALRCRRATACTIRPASVRTSA